MAQPVPALPRATHHGVWEKYGIDCYVLDDGRRVMSQRGVLRCITGGTTASDLDRYVTRAVGENGLIPGVEALSKNGTRMIVREAKDVAAVAQLFVDAAIDGRLREDQRHLAKGASALLGGLAGIALDALVDEITGYQYERPADALRSEIDRILTPVACDWDEMWPRELIVTMARLYGMPWDGAGRYPFWTQSVMHQVHLAVFGDAGVSELHRISPNPRESTVRRHQHFTDEMRTAFRERHLPTVKALLIAAHDPADFLNALRAAYGRAPRQKSLW